jgi:hypothetical protein
VRSFTASTEASEPFSLALAVREVGIRAARETPRSADHIG